LSRAALTERFPSAPEPFQTAKALPSPSDQAFSIASPRWISYSISSGAMEFMPAKQIRLSGESWPDRVIGELPNIYIYSVNNPSEGSIAKRRSTGNWFHISRPQSRTPGTLKNLVMATGKREKSRLFESIEELFTTVESFCDGGRGPLKCSV
jgi:hypothetical protein